jgi:DNA-binding protein
MSKENIVYIGRKPIMNYVLAVLNSFQNNQDEVILQARGRAISTAVDTSEVVKRYYKKDLDVTVSIGTEELAKEGYGKRNVSTMKIVLVSNDHDEPPKTVISGIEKSGVEKMGVETPNEMENEE